MSEEETIDVKLSVVEAKALATAAQLGMQSGKLLTVFKSAEEDMALVSAIVRLKQAMDAPKPPVCEECNGTGIIETGNNDLPCDCAAGDTTMFNVARIVSGKAVTVAVSGGELKLEHARHAKLVLAMPKGMLAGSWHVEGCATADGRPCCFEQCSNPAAWIATPTNPLAVERGPWPVCNEHLNSFPTLDPTHRGEIVIPLTNPSGEARTIVATLPVMNVPTPDESRRGADDVSIIILVLADWIERLLTPRTGTSLDERVRDVVMEMVRVRNQLVAEERGEP